MSQGFLTSGSGYTEFHIKQHIFFLPKLTESKGNLALASLPANSNTFNAEKENWQETVVM